MTGTYVTDQLATYISDPPEVPAAVMHRAKLHLLDTLAAIVSGGDLSGGRHGAEYVRRLGGPGEAIVFADAVLAPAPSAALANGMAAHADETDDSHAGSLTHPGCAVIPAALAAAETGERTGRDLLTAIVTGYDVCSRVTRAMGIHAYDGRSSAVSSHSVGGLFGAAAAAAQLSRLDVPATSAALSYAAQLSSGVTAWLRDEHHVLKAFVFGGMPAWHGVTAAHLVAAGLPGMPAVFDLQPNFLDTFTSNADPDELIRGLGSEYAVTETTIKRYAVGSPAQAAVECIVDLIRTGAVTSVSTEDIEIRLPSHMAAVVDGRRMPNINVQYLVAATLVDGAFSFRMSHDDKRLEDASVRRLMGRTRVVADPELDGARRARVTVVTTDGARHERKVEAVRGTPANPMDEDDVVEKTDDLLGECRVDARGLAEFVFSIDRQDAWRHRLREIIGSQRSEF